MSTVGAVTNFPRLYHLPHVVVVGGGFAGLAAARGLAGKKVRVTIVDAHNFHTFAPLLYQVATAGLEPADVAYPIRTVFGHADNVHFRHGRVAASRPRAARRAPRRRRAAPLRPRDRRDRGDRGLLRRARRRASTRCRCTRWPTRAGCATGCC